MKDRFKDILTIEDVYGILFLSLDGKIVFKEFRSHAPGGVKDGNLHALTHVLNGIQEAELIFDKNRLYVRKTETGTILVVMERSAQIAMVRLNCDIIVPSFNRIEKKSKSRGLGRFFRKK
jgi:hypothetical protein